MLDAVRLRHRSQVTRLQRVTKLYFVGPGLDLTCRKFRHVLFKAFGQLSAIFRFS